MADVLEPIARGEVSAGDARRIAFNYLEENPSVSALYAALLRWVWVSISERRKDDELREWHGVILDVASKAKRKLARPEASQAQGEVSFERIRALADLLKVSVSMQNRPSADKLMSRAHVAEILTVLKTRDEAPVRRSDIRSALDLKDANLSRILTLLVLEGLATRRTVGKQALFAITAEGERLLAERERKLSKAPPQSKNELSPALALEFGDDRELLTTMEDGDADILVSVSDAASPWPPRYDGAHLLGDFRAVCRAPVAGALPYPGWHSAQSSDLAMIYAQALLLIGQSKMSGHVADVSREVLGAEIMTVQGTPSARPLRSETPEYRPEKSIVAKYKGVSRIKTTVPVRAVTS